ncbi:dihydroorotate dehydrogenase electron transfer subunit [Candidatus Poribacteria bacterium]|nr:dihydroorotate dehydrogenase electron transfer subunit [Candidatus Poribacteria bacterium]
MIVAKEPVAPGHYRMRLTCDWESAEPGQFLHLWLPECRDPLLRRPYTVYRLRDGHLDILFQVVGEGTALLAERSPGDVVRVLGPLGNGFSMPPAGSTPYVVGGGVGMASLHLLVERLIEGGFSPRVLIGARSTGYVLCRDDLDALGVTPDISTNDGSEGYHGFVTDLLQTRLERDPAGSPVIYTCGPTPMMAAVAKIAAQREIDCQVALENRMGCALGVCLGCVVPIRSESGVGYQRVCTEGPVFDARTVEWGYRV